MIPTCTIRATKNTEIIFQLFLDSYYTSPQLVFALAKVGVWCCGSMKSTGRSHIPKDIMSGDAMDKKKRERGHIMHQYCNNGIMITHNWIDCRPVVICTSLRHIGDGVSAVECKEKNENGKFHYITITRPMAVEYYNTYMRGVDVAYVY